MGFSLILQKRTLILCAFLVYGCSDANNESVTGQNDLEPKTSNSTSLTSKKTLESEELPLLTLHELLSATDVKKALALAATNNDESLLIKWQSLLLQAADEVKLPKNEKTLLEGEQGLKYLKFQGLKSNYQAAFQTAFVEFEDMDEVYRTYPEFSGLRDRSIRLVENRNALVESVAKELVKQNFDGDTYQEAKRQWQAYIKSQAPFNHPKQAQ